MRLQVINPNTSGPMTAKIGDAAREAASPGTEIVAACPAHGPASIEGHFEEAIATAALLDEIEAGVRQGVDAHVIACFGDPGLLAARELASGPVLGIAEAAMHAATFVATHFSVVTTLERTVVIAEHLLDRYGFRQHCRRVRAADVPVLDLEEAGSHARLRILDECRRARDDDRAGAIVLGCAGMADLARELSAELGVPVIDGVAAAVRFAEALVGIGVGTSKHGDLARPEPKTFLGRYSHWSA
ncbi:MAG TPA: aspartate/glutamate racemase family protein [Gammaproteobacteria bacterium]|nr:aspartate/glutamate racemase family protein [Gammaproteobacteria bacterium]